MLTIKEIKQATKCELINANENTIVKGVSTDTRTIRKGELFIALKGPNFDGHMFLKDALKKGACAAVVSDFKLDRRNIPVPLIEVTDTKKALGDIARFYRDKLKIPIVGVTGSNGKTTTKDMVAHILSKSSKVAKTLNTENNFIGVPLTLLRIKDESYAVIEMGTNIPGEIDYLAKITRPDIGIITNIGPSHLEGLKNEQNILREKTALFKYLTKNGSAVINHDDKLLSGLKINNRVLTFGIKNKYATFYAEKINFHKNGIDFILNRKYKVKISVLGIHNVYNALAAIAACSCLGIPIQTAQGSIADFKAADMRFNITSLNGINIINDAYNSNPLSMAAAIDTLMLLKTSGKKIAVCGDMLELGKTADRLHYKTGKRIAKSKVDFLITVGKLSHNIADGAKENGMDSNAVKACNTCDEAARHLARIIKPDDTVLVKGSRSTGMEEVIKCFTTYYTR